MSKAAKSGGRSAFTTIFVFAAIAIGIFFFAPDIIEAAGNLMGAAIGVAIGLIATVIAISVGLSAALLAAIIGAIALAAAIFMGGMVVLTVGLFFLAPFILIFLLLMMAGKKSKD